MTVHRITEVPQTIIQRLKTGIHELDWIYGVTEGTFTSGPNKGRRYATWGMPAGKISLWAGAGGIGKSRAAIQVAKVVARKKGGYNVLYFQNEVDNGTFVNWVKADGKGMPENLFISSSSAIQDQVADINLGIEKRY